jgi:hypothetical protein
MLPRAVLRGVCKETVATADRAADNEREKALARWVVVLLGGANVCVE